MGVSHLCQAFVSPDLASQDLAERPARRQKVGLCVTFAPVSGTADPIGRNEQPSVRTWIMKQL